MNIYNWYEQDKLKIVCTNLAVKKKISYSDWVLDVSYFKSENSEEIKSGYHIWAQPLLAIMKKNSVAENVVTHCARWLIEDIKYKKGLRSSCHKRGFLLRHFVFNPFSWCLGSLSLMAQGKKTIRFFVVARP